MYAQEHLIRDRFSRHACVKCGARHTGDDVLVLARRGAAWLIMLTCTQCQRRGVYVVSVPHKRRANVPNEAANSAQLADGTAGVIEQSAIGQSAMSETELPGQGVPPDQLVALDQITPLDQLEQLEHTQYLDTKSSWSELWPEPFLDHHALSLPPDAVENADTTLPDSPGARDTSSMPTLPPPTNPQQPRPQWFSQHNDATPTQPPLPAPSSSATPPPHQPHAAKRVTHADVDAIRSFLSRFNGDFLRLFGGANPGEQL